MLVACYLHGQRFDLTHNEEIYVYQLRPSGGGIYDLLKVSSNVEGGVHIWSPPIPGG